jgi:hypothetical protein
MMCAQNSDVWVLGISAFEILIFFALVSVLTVPVLLRGAHTLIVLFVMIQSTIVIVDVANCTDEWWVVYNAVMCAILTTVAWLHMRNVYGMSVILYITVLISTLPVMFSGLGFIWIIPRVLNSLALMGVLVAKLFTHRPEESFVM